MSLCIKFRVTHELGSWLVGLFAIDSSARLLHFDIVCRTRLLSWAAFHRQHPRWQAFRKNVFTTQAVRPKAHLVRLISGEGVCRWIASRTYWKIIVSTLWLIFSDPCILSQCISRPILARLPRLSAMGTNCHPAFQNLCYCMPRASHMHARVKKTMAGRVAECGFDTFKMVMLFKIISCEVPLFRALRSKLSM